MKKFTFILVLIGMITLQSCEGPQGPPGRDGFSVEAEVFEVTTNFGPQNDYSRFINLNPPILASDVVLVYVLWEVDGGTPIWRLMPQTVQLFEGDLQYNYDFTRFDVNIFLSSLDFNLGILGPEWTQNQRFRIVIIPGYFSGRMDFRNYEQVMAMNGLTEADVKPISARQ
ncbi:hypothetical protein [Flavobacterium lacus]|uniref:Uncharacterized protein n=1 Tax=Flavobacterium lacus TaxID=1353778 RepID=A0A328WK07_9FLAO|nr:hypothetical protein [Flavobacterium lacus]RAR46550.1 hypothetical protein B0I10_11746 [Flavobacterium lacus]